MNQAIIVYMDIPESGRAFSGLTPFFSREDCAGLHKALLQDFAELLEDAFADLYVAYSGEPAVAEELRSLFRSAEFFPNVGWTAGERMSNAMTKVMEYGYERCLLIIPDVPAIRNEELNRAFDLLKRNDYVFGPMEDGGYWLAGAKAGDLRLLRLVFGAEEYDRKQNLHDALDMIPSWMNYTLLEEKYSINTIGNLLLYREEAEGKSGDFLRKHHVISVIVPVRNEVAEIHKFVRELDKFHERCEVIFAVGRSEDGSDAVIREIVSSHNGKYRMIQEEGSRAALLNAGAEAANGDILFFLNMNSILPQDPVREIFRVIDTHEAGCFGIRYRNPDLPLQMQQRWTNRCARNGIIAGEHGLFVQREAFYQAGMYREIPDMEDLQISLDLQQSGITTGMTEETLTVEERRFPGGLMQKMRQIREFQHIRQQYIEEHRKRNK